MSGYQKVAGQTVAGFLFRSSFGHRIFCFFQIKRFKIIYRIMVVEALRKQRKEVHSKQQLGDKTL